MRGISNFIEGDCITDTFLNCHLPKLSCFRGLQLSCRFIANRYQYISIYNRIPGSKLIQNSIARQFMVQQYFHPAIALPAFVCFIRGDGFIFSEIASVLVPTSSPTRALRKYFLFGSILCLLFETSHQTTLEPQSRSFSTVSFLILLTFLVIAGGKLPSVVGAICSSS